MPNILLHQIRAKKRPSLVSNSFDHEIHEKGRRLCVVFSKTVMIGELEAGREFACSKTTHSW